MENEEYNDRKIYYHGISDLQLSHWIELSDEQAKKWYELPHGSVVVYDEAQQHFKRTNWKNDAPEHYSRLNEHRHGGYDIYLITQHPALIDVSIRRLIGEHVHYDRRFGSNHVNRYVWQRGVDDPNDYHTKQESVRSTIKLDKKMFGLYHSAEVHTHKRKYPLKVIGSLALLLLAPFALWFGFSSVATPTEVSQEEAQPRATTHVAGTRSTGYEYTDYVPRVPGLPHTAPIYDSLTSPVAYPKYNCVLFSKSVHTCRCYTQQATLMDVPVAICAEIIKNGLFDHALPDTRPETQGRGQSQPYAHRRTAADPVIPEPRQRTSIRLNRQSRTET